MTRSVRTAIAAIGIALVAGTIATPVLAADAPYNATVAGQRSFTPLVEPGALVDAERRRREPACRCGPVRPPLQGARRPAAATDPVRRVHRSRCAYVTADAALRATVTHPDQGERRVLRHQPEPDRSPPRLASRWTAACRRAIPARRRARCTSSAPARTAANPAYMRFWPTVFSPVKADRKTDVATVSLDGAVVAKGAKPKLAANKATTVRGDACLGPDPVAVVRQLLGRRRQDHGAEEQRHLHRDASPPPVARTTCPS